MIKPFEKNLFTIFVGIQLIFNIFQAIEFINFKKN